jgi:hypothetical protein
VQEKPDVVIRRYPNRRLYDTSCARFVPLPALLAHVQARRSLCVVCTETGRDLTRAVLLQLLFHTLEHDPLERLSADALYVLLQPGADGGTLACTALDAATRAEHPMPTHARNPARPDDTESRLRAVEARLRELEQEREKPRGV